MAARPDDPHGMGMVDGHVKTMTEEEYKKALAERQHDEVEDADQEGAEEDFSDLDDLLEGLEDTDVEDHSDAS